MMRPRVFVALEFIAILALVALLAPSFAAFRKELKIQATSASGEVQPQDKSPEKPADEPVDKVPRVAIARIHNGVGEDDLGDEYVEIENQGGLAVDMKGWTLRTSSGFTYTFDDTNGCTPALQPGGKIRLWTRAGNNSCYQVSDDALWFNLYWGSSAPLMNNGHDTLVLFNANGEEAGRYSY